MRQSISTKWMICLYKSGIPTDSAGRKLLKVCHVQHPARFVLTLIMVQKLRILFATFGVLESAKDNVSQFTRGEGQNFGPKNVMCYNLIPPYHPASNRLAERGVWTFEGGYQKISEETLKHRIIQFFSQYRATSHTRLVVHQQNCCLEGI